MGPAGGAEFWQTTNELDSSRESYRERQVTPISTVDGSFEK